MQHWHAFWHRNLCNAQFSSWPKKMTETAKKKKKKPPSGIDDKATNI